MAGYYHGGSEIQGEGLQTLYLMNPGYVGYSSDALAGASATGAGNMVFLNAAGNPIPPGNLSHLQQQNSPFVGFPLQATVASSPPPPQDMNRPPGGRHDTSVVHGFAPRLHYNLWTSMDSSTGASVPAAHQAIQAEAIASQFGLRRGGGPAQQQQGLSLSLSPQQPAYSSYRSGNEIPAPPAAISPGSGGGDDARVSGSTSSNSGVSNGIAGIQGVLMGSKYLKSAQELLEEVVNVGNGIKDEKMKGSKAPANANNDQVTAPENSGGDPSGKQSTELTTAERQELQMKKAKLVNMLDEVEQRYRQYHQQMQIVVAAFEAAAGPRSARTYTSLALQTISRQFRCLRDAITGQIKAARRSLGEDVEGQAAQGGGTGGSSRLRAVEQQLRQQRALQQLGMIQPHAWRPQRGLPERSVSVLRAWLFEHFLHPYPKDSDKLMLAKQTGLTRSQVSNWFINARVRLWKPMVEEMYTEEVKEQERSGGSEGKVGKSEAGEEPTPKSTSVAPPPESNIPSNVEHMNHLKSNIDSDHTMGQPSCFALLGDSSDAPSVAFHGEEEEIVQGGSKKMKNAFHDQFHHTISLMGSGGMELKPNGVGGGDHEQFCGRRPNGFSLIDASGDQGGGGFGAYQNYMDQFAPRFTGNGVSLSLGLPHCENGLSLAVAGGPPNFLSGQGIQMGRRIDQIENEENDFCNMGATSSAATQSASAFENINIQNRKRFAAQLLPDFVV